MKESRPKILIVDDEPVICELLENELSEQNYTCKTAFNGENAFEKLEKNRFDLVLLDIKLPDMSGIHLLGEITANYPDTPVIMVTGVIDIDTAVVAMKMGASDYIVKPFDLNKLIASVKRTMSEREFQGTIKGRSRKKYTKEDAKSLVGDPIINELDAIYHGVEQRIDHIIGSSKIVTERTVQIAGRLQIPEGKIRQWKEGRLKSILDRKEPAYSPEAKDEQKFVSCAIMNAVNLLIDKD